MNTLDCIKERRSIRNFNSRIIEKETIEEIISCASFAPSWKNSQITRYIAIQSPDLISKVASQTTSENNKKIIQNAPLVIAVTIIKNRSGFERDGSYSTSKKDGWQMFDAGIASQTFSLAAYEKNIGTVIMGIFNHDEVSETLDLPKDRELVALIAAGYYDHLPSAPRRKNVDDLLLYK